MKTKSLSIFLVALFVVEMNLGAEENKNENKKGEKIKYEIMKEGDINKFDCILKMILIGNSMVGKSALITKICKNEFSDVYSATVGFDFFFFNFRIVSDEDNPVLKYQIWDCCGREDCRNIITGFYQNARVFLLAYDVTNKKSFDDINGWVNDVKAKNTDKSIPFVLIGNKIDLEDARVVSKEAGKKFAEENGMEFVEVSAKTGVGIKELENILAKIIYEDFKKHKKKEIVENYIEDDFKVEGKSTHSSSLCDCCKEICDNC